MCDSLYVCTVRLICISITKLCYVPPGGSIWEHMAAAGSIWQHLAASGLIASGSIWDPPAAYGNKSHVI